MKNRSGALSILLRELPAEGRDFEFTRETGELDAVLKDLVGSNPYSFTFRLTPMGNTFDLRGTIATKLDRECSVCTESVTQEVHRLIHEYILVEPKLEKRDHGVKANHAHEWEEDGPDYTVLEADVFDVGAFAHEAIALLEPVRPLCAPEAPGGCAHRDRLPARDWLTYDDSEAKASAELRTNPFRILEKVKLKS